MQASLANKSASSYIPTLDGWRALAVTLVIGAHSTAMLDRNGSAPARHVATLFNHAGYGVDIFFALSGFLICTLLLREKERSQTISLWRFYARRACRILPPMMLYLLGVGTLSLLRRLPDISTSESLAVIFFYRNYVFGTWYTGHFWSLAVEEHFYFFAPFFILLLSRKWAVRMSFVLIACCIAIRSYEFSHNLFAGALLQFRTENRFDGLLWGCLLAFALRDPTVEAWLRKHLTLFTFAATLVAAIVLLTVFGSQPERRTLVALFMPALIAYTVLHPEQLVGRFLELPVLKWLGRISYSLYLWQMLFLPERERPLGLAQHFPFALILPVVCAAISFYLVEKPMMRFGHRIARAPGSNPASRYS